MSLMWRGEESILQRFWEWNFCVVGMGIHMHAHEILNWMRFWTQLKLTSNLYAVETLQFSR
jgi:hypothetical protein